MATTDMDMEACIAAGTPGEHHKALKQFEGTWSATVRHWMDPSAPPHETTGVMTNKLELGDRFLKQDYACDANQFFGAGYFGYNNVTREYEGLWIDSMSTGMMNERGQRSADGKTWDMTGQIAHPVTGDMMTKRSRITVHSPDRHVMEMFFAGPDGSEFKSMEIEYIRKA